jgi:ribosomal protein S27AE
MSDRSPDYLAEGVAVERRSPETVFALLGDDIRVGILSALGETPDEAVPFAELHRRVGVRDSGQFNYHLGKLRDSFVRRTDDGYELTHAGRQIVGAMYAGTFTADAAVEAVPVPDPCPVCGGSLVAEYGDEVGRIRCTSCAEFRNEFGFPPGSLDQFDREDLPYAFDRWMRHVLGGVVAGFCYLCAGRMDGRLVLDDPEERVASLPGHVEYECGRCGSNARIGPDGPALFHPAVEGFLFENGHDVWTDPSWTVGTRHPPETTVRSTDPPKLAVRFTGEDGTLTTVLGPDGTVTGVERTPAD